MITKEEQCTKRVWSNMFDSQCQRKAVKDGFCTIHHPDYIKAKDAERQKKWNEKWTKRQALQKEQEAIDNVKNTAYEACKSINEEHPELVAKHLIDMYRVLQEANLQIEYLDCKYAKTGTSQAILTRIADVLSKIKGGE
jgi:hypothetical protein